jgi:hypothetical protein
MRCSQCTEAHFHSQWLICYARKHGLIPVLPSLRCSWTSAAHSDWPLPERCSWYMRYAFPGDAGSYRDHSFFHKFTSLAKENASFAVSVSEITSFNMSSISGDASPNTLGSVIVVSPIFWRESRHSWFIRDWLPSLHYWLPLEHQETPLAAACVPLVENPRSVGCC